MASFIQTIVLIISTTIMVLVVLQVDDDIKRIEKKNLMKFMKKKNDVNSTKLLC